MNNLQKIIPFQKNKVINLTRRQHKFLSLERATIAEWQSASEGQKFVAKPTQLHMTLFFWNDIADNATFRKLFWFALSCSILGVSGIIVLWVLSKKKLNRVSTEQEKRFSRWLSSCFEIISHLKGKWHYIYVSLLMTFVTQSITISIFYFAARALGFYDIPLKTFFLAVPLGMLVMALPLTPAGVGTSQAAFLLMFQWIGVPSSFSGADVCTVVQIIVVTTSLVSGFWFYIKYKRGSIKSDWKIAPETTS